MSLNTKIRTSICVLLIFLLGLTACSRNTAEQSEKKESVSQKRETDSQIEEIEVDETLSPEEQLEDKVTQKLESMTTEEKVAQLFVITPEALTGIGTAVAAGDATRNAIAETPVGGLIYMSANLERAEQTQEMLSNTQIYSYERIGLPLFLCVDEEGGSVARVSGHLAGIEAISSMQTIGQTGDSDQAYQTGQEMGSYLSKLGFNVDFAPVADVLTNAENTVVADRSFGSDPVLVSEMAIALASGLEENGVLATYKHFPGHGATAADSHQGYAYTNKTLEELEESELIPFRNAIETDASFIMVGHISLPNMTQEDVPSSLSSEIMTELLRNQMGYEGIIITDALNMGAITEEYPAGEAAVKAVQAGADMILMPADFEAAYSAVLDAVASGTISEEQLNASVSRILRVKYDKLNGEAE